MTEAVFNQTFQKALAAEDKTTARVALRQMFETTPNLTNAQLVLKYANEVGFRTTGEEFKVAILRAYTVEPLLPLLQASATLAGLNLRVQVGGFNTYVQDVLSPDSWLYSFGPQMIILALQGRDLLPRLWDRVTESSSGGTEMLVSSALADLGNLLDVLRSRCNASILLPTLDVPVYPRAGILDAQALWGDRAAVDAFNRSLREMAAAQTGVYIVDVEALAGRFGRARWYDDQKWNLARLPFAADALMEIAREYMRYVHVLSGRLCKVIAVDLDNTLWGGVVGEDGLDGIRLVSGHGGAAYLEVQRVLLDLYGRGILLAICSKNNIDDAMAVLERHPSMLLRPTHFAAVRINWEDKAQNLREIADELNLGLDSIAFVDDNPAERDRVLQELPEVHVLDLPENPLHYAQTIRQFPYFERLAVSTEDRERSRYYAEERQRREIRRVTTSIEDFYRSLDMEVEIGEADSKSIARIAQLTQKTNQFNLTSRRYSEQEISALRQQMQWRVYWLRSRDRFGDNGIVGVAIAKLDATTCLIDTLLLSCRVIGRTIEAAMLAEIAEEARGHGARFLRGYFIPTAKNAPAKDFYSLHGFTCEEATSDGASLWRLDMTEMMPKWPDWISRSGALRTA
jgi:FkbH-like protein